MGPAEIAEWIRVAPWLAALLAVAWGTVWLVRKVAPAVRKLGHLVDDLVGEPERPGVPGRPGLMERMGAVEDVAEIIRHEMFPNSGKSLRDKLDQTSAAVDTLSSDVTTINDKLDQDRVRLGAVEEKVTDAIKIIEEHHS